MERINAKFHDRDGKRREGDIIWRIPTTGGEDVVLYILCEFQSTVDWWMAVRTQVYEGLLWQHIIAEKKLKPGDRLPPLWPWQPLARYHLLDMGAVPEDDLAVRGSLAALLFRLEHPHEPEELAGLIDDAVGWFRHHPGYDDLKRLFTELVRQAIEGYEASVAVPGELMEMRSMLANLGETWKKRWIPLWPAPDGTHNCLKFQRRGVVASTLFYAKRINGLGRVPPSGVAAIEVLTRLGLVKVS
jgi:hypothetical protein